MGKEFLSNIWLRIAIAAILLCLYVPHYLAVKGIQPPVGVYIAVLGALAVAVTLRREPGIREKACWIIVITVLMVAEVRNLYVEADRQRTESQKVSNALDKTNTALEKTLAGLSAVVEQLNTITGGITDATNMETGGNSFCYVIPAFLDDSGFGIILDPVGNYPLYGVTMTVLDERINTMKPNSILIDPIYIKVGDISPPGSSIAPEPNRISFRTPSDHQELTVVFRGRNGWWSQLWRLRKINGKWEQAFIVTGLVDKKKYPKGSVLKRYISKGFPEAKLDTDSRWQESGHLPIAVY